MEGKVGKVNIGRGNKRKVGLVGRGNIREGWKKERS